LLYRFFRNEYADQQYPQLVSGNIFFMADTVIGSFDTVSPEPKEKINIQRF